MFCAFLILFLLSIFLDVFHCIRNMFSYKKQKSSYSRLSELKIVFLITRNLEGRLSRAGIIVSSVVRDSGFCYLSVPPSLVCWLLSFILVASWSQGCLLCF